EVDFILSLGGAANVVASSVGSGLISNWNRRIWDQGYRYRGYAGNEGAYGNQSGYGVVGRASVVPSGSTCWRWCRWRHPIRRRGLSTGCWRCCVKIGLFDGLLS
uniref:Uncharacterized protein n=1 Tax=Solanum lycopersicum TaxID=4081 RepID=A0A3Q7I5I9_SOLLC